MSSCKERQAKRREKIKKNKELYDAYLDKDRKRKAAKCATLKQKMSQSQMEKHKLQERLCLRKHREKKKAEAQQCSANEGNQMATGTPYRSTQSLGKAVKRAQVSLPSSPRKKQCVIENLAKQVGLEILNSSPSQPQSSAPNDETKTAVDVFYNSNDITWEERIE